MPGRRGGCADLVKCGQVNARIGLLIEPDAGDVIQAMRNKGRWVLQGIPATEVNALGVPRTQGTRTTEVKARSKLPGWINAGIQPPGSVKLDGGSRLAVAIAVAGVKQHYLVVTAGCNQSLQQGLPACRVQRALIAQVDQFVVLLLFTGPSHPVDWVCLPEGVYTV
ncbi:hypothetical protein D3C81_1542060 [compost metagenome]